MTLATKAELRTDVGNWLNRSSDADFLARFDTFLALAEGDFGTKLKSKVNERRLTAPLNEQWEANPAGSQAIKSISILSNGAYQSSGPLEFLSYQEAIRLYGSNAAGQVCAYTKVGTQIGFFPAPSTTSTITFEIIAYVRPDPLVAEDSDNEILLTYPGVYLYGVLFQTADYYGRAEDKVKWGESYLAVIADANQEQASSASDILIERVA